MSIYVPPVGDAVNFNLRSYNQSTSDNINYDVGGISHTFSDLIGPTIEFTPFAYLSTIRNFKGSLNLELLPNSLAFKYKLFIRKCLESFVQQKTINLTSTFNNVLVN